MVTLIFFVSCENILNNDAEYIEGNDLTLGDFKALTSGDWGHATTCKAIPNLTPLADPHITVSLNGLTLHLVDRAGTFSKVYPVGVGEINNKVGEKTYEESLSMFPVLNTMQNDFNIRMRSVNPCRIWWKDPDSGNDLPVFAGLPFMSFYGAYGIHGPIRGTGTIRYKFIHI